MRLEILYLDPEILSKTAQSHGGSKYGNKDREDREFIEGIVIIKTAITTTCTATTSLDKSNNLYRNNNNQQPLS